MFFVLLLPARFGGRICELLVCLASLTASGSFLGLVGKQAEISGTGRRVLALRE